MSAPQTATVEVLTAEVRVLMVGARQVTLSVYNQLDWVGHAEIEPFGRVNARSAAGPGALCVVGRSARPVDRGALVRCALSHYESVREVWRSWQALPLIVFAGLR